MVGKKTIHIRTSTNNTRWVTVAVTIAGDSTLLLSKIIFKGNHDGRTAQMEFVMHPAAGLTKRTLFGIIIFKLIYFFYV